MCTGPRVGKNVQFKGGLRNDKPFEMGSRKGTGRLGTPPDSCFRAYAAGNKDG